MRGGAVAMQPQLSKSRKKMICQRTDFESGMTKVLGFLSVSDADIESAEREVFPDVFGNIKYDDVETDEEKAVIARSLKYFAFVQLSNNRNAQLKINADMTGQAQSYGVTDKGTLLNVWAKGVQQAEADIDELKDYYREITLKAEIRI